jgi:hypothetical protein
MRRFQAFSIAVFAIPGLLSLAGCEREISHTEKTEIKDDGTVKSKERTVTQSPDGKTTVTEERKTTDPTP